MQAGSISGYCCSRAPAQAELAARRRRELGRAGGERREAAHGRNEREIERRRGVRAREQRSLSLAARGRGFGCPRVRAGGLREMGLGIGRMGREDGWEPQVARVLAGLSLFVLVFLN